MISTLINFLIVAAIFAGEGQSNSLCTVRDDPFAASTTTRILGATFYIDLNNPFTCYGIVTHFKFCYKRSPGALSDTVYVGVYMPNSDGDRYIRDSYNSIRVKPLRDRECLTVDANPHIVVQKGYVLAFYVTFAYIELYVDQDNGYLYKSAAFPSSIGRGALIRTSSKYAPKIQAIISNLDLQPVTSSTGLLATPGPTPTPSSQPFIPLLPLPTGSNTSGIPFPDISGSVQCVMGVQEAFVANYNTSSAPFLNHGQPATCSGTINRWELCYQGSEQYSTITVGIWRREEGNFNLVVEEEFVIEPEIQSEIGEFVCAVFGANVTEEVQPGDVIGFISENIFVAFSNRDIESPDDVASNSTNTSSSNEVTIALVRAIIDQPAEPDEISTTVAAVPTSSVSLQSSPSSTFIPPSPILISTAAIILGLLFGVLLVTSIGVVLSLIGLLFWRNHRFKALSIGISRNNTQPMTYNLTYTAHDSQQQQVVMRDHSDTLVMKENLCYSMEDQEPAAADTNSNKSLDHTYELI